MNILYGNSGTSVLLAFVKVLSAISGIISTMIVSHALDLEMYGTYSQAVLIMTTATSISALGLPDAVNYYYNKNLKVEDQKRYINTIIGLQFLVGIVVGLLILVSTKSLVIYFDNAQLASYVFLLILRPLFSNVNCSLQHLVVSIGKARTVALRNAVFAIFRIVAFCIAAYFLKDMSIILILYLLFEIMIMFVFYRIMRNESFMICPIKMDWKIVKEIFSYCIPIGIYVLTSTLSRDVDKLLIGGRYTTDEYAIYANCSTLLPFDIVSVAFVTVLVPLLTRYFGTKDYYKGQLLFQNYLKIGYYTSFAFTIACMILSREMIMFLYGDKYLPGQTVFVLYTLVDMVKFANLSFILSACGKTKTLMKASLLAFVGNIILNYLFVEMFGYIGPALATVVVFICQTISLLHLSAVALQTSILKIFNWKELGQYVLGLIPISLICYIIRLIMHRNGIHHVAILIVVGCLFVCVAVFLNKKSILATLKAINNLG